jgi:hypothetical protein
MSLYTLEPDENTLHGFFSPDLSPVLTIESGDTVRTRTLDAEWALEPFTTFTPGGPPPGPRATTDVVRPGSWRWSWGGGDLVDGME